MKLREEVRKSVGKAAFGEELSGVTDEIMQAFSETLDKLERQLPDKIIDDGGVAVALSNTQDLWKAATTAHNNVISEVQTLITQFKEDLK
jgi:hypothetical protein